MDFYWSSSSLEIADQGRFGGYTTALVDDVERLISSGRPDEAIRILSTDNLITDTYRRRLIAKALQASERWSELSSFLVSPHNEEELAMYYMASERSGDMLGVGEVLASCESSGEFSPQLLAELKQRLRVHETLGRRAKVVTTAIPYHVEINRIIELLASQIYQTPLALLRENCQNAFDAVLERIYRDPEFENPEITVTITSGRIQV